MSLKTWKEEFYPKEPSKRMSKKAAIEHSLQKWLGLRKSNLKKHAVVSDSFEGKLYDTDPNSDDIFYVTSVSCALCEKYEVGIDCRDCPLYKHLGNQRCDALGNTPYRIWMKTGNPASMIKALKALLEEK